MSSSLTQFFQTRLAARENSGLKRALTTLPSELIDFASNDYLGLARSNELFQIIENESRKFQRNVNGSTGSRLLTGNSAYATDAEQTLSDFFKAEAGLICNSGYTANLAVLSAVAQKNDTILYDELAHASIKDGARLSLAKRFSFRHNDVNDLEHKLSKATGHTFIAVESIYSMDGDECNLKAICEIAKKHNASVVLDEAHSTGLFKGGAGLAVSQDLVDAVDIRIYTFGKAPGVHGSFIAGSRELIEFLVNFSRPFIYTTAPSPHSIASMQCAMHFIGTHPELFQDLQSNIKLYNSLVEGVPGASQNNSAIQTILVPGNENVRGLATGIHKLGFDVRPILSPTVPRDQERLRICLHAFNTRDEVQGLCLAIRNAIT